MGSISLVGVGKVYGENTVAATDINLEIEDGEFVVFVGPSGCGKSTLLRMIAGLESVTSGQIKINGETVNNVVARDRDIAMVFQNYALYPQMTVRQNIAFALEIRKLPKTEIGRRVTEAARILDLTALLERKPRQLSGGQRQRVAMGRAIVRNPEAFLLDEPLSNLDAKLRVQLRAELGRLHKSLGVTTLHVTHDQVEAMTLGSRVAVFSAGNLQQYDTPHTLYNEPKNIFVASFIGSPSMNFLEGVVTQISPNFVIDIGNSRIDQSKSIARNSFKLGDKAIVGVRPEHLSWAARVSEQVDDFSGEVEMIEHLEPESFVTVKLTDSSAKIRYAEEFETAAVSDQDELHASNDQVLTMRVSADSLPQSGSTISMIIDGSRAHLFDAVTGNRK